MSPRPRVIKAGERCGRLTVTTDRKGSEEYIAVHCDCGNAHRVLARDWGRTVSCGCLSSQSGDYIRKHGRSGTPEYQCWRNMLARCGNPGHQSYAHYGGRGITVVDRWKTFAHFYADMGDR